MNKDEIIIQEAMEFMDLCESSDFAASRINAIKDIKFAYGDQWPGDMQNQLKLQERPMLTINKLYSMLKDICNSQRQQRPRITANPANNDTDKKTSDVVNGMIRHIENRSNADTAYDTAFEFAAAGGFGYFRLRTDYEDEKSRNQEILVESIYNPFSVFFDPYSIELDGSDAMKCLIVSEISRKQFERDYPGVDLVAFTSSAVGAANGWVKKDHIRIGEYFRVVDKKAKLCYLSNGVDCYEDELPSEEILQQSGISIVGERDSYKRAVEWYKLSAIAILERNTILGKHIPIIPVYGERKWIDGKIEVFGIVRNARDPQRMINYWQTSITESVALAPKAKWVMAEGQDEGHENEWNRANTIALATLRYKQKDIDGEMAPPPIRLQPEPPPQGAMMALEMASENLREVVGVTDPAQRVAGNVSGKALMSARAQQDNANFHYFDNLTISMAHAGRIMLGWFPEIYDTERAIRIVGDDGQPEIVTINQKTMTAEGNVIRNNVAVGKYEIIMDAGPGYLTKRQEALASMAPLMNNEHFMQVAGDLFFRNSDFPGAEIIADRMAAINPLAQIDKQSDMPMAAQIQIKALQTQLQQLGQQLQAAQQEIKTKAGLEQMKQDAETQRELMRSHVKAHDTETWAQHEKEENDKDNQTKLAIEEIQANVALLLARIDERKELNKIEGNFKAAAES